MEDERKKHLETEKKEQGSDEQVTMDIEIPYLCKPLKEAKEIPNKRGVALDPTYLD